MRETGRTNVNASHRRDSEKASTEARNQTRNQTQRFNTSGRNIQWKRKEMVTNHGKFFEKRDEMNKLSRQSSFKSSDIIQIVLKSQYNIARRFPDNNSEIGCWDICSNHNRLGSDD